MVILETSRIILRSFEERDLLDLTRMMIDDEVMKYTGFRGAQSKEKVVDCLARWKGEGVGPLGVWCASEKESGEFVGWFMLKKTSFEFPELGFMLAKNKWGQGFASEVSLALINYAFLKLGMTKIVATTVAENLASVAVLTKIGMKPSELTAPKDPVYQILCFEIPKGASRYLG